MKYDTNKRSIIFAYENLLLGRSQRFTEGLFDDTKTIESKAKKWLVAKNLGVPLKQLYEDEPLEYFHTAITDRKKDDFFYYNNKIRIAVTSKMNENTPE